MGAQSEFENLLALLRGLPEGPISNVLKNRVIHHLAECWTEFEGSGSARMTSAKLHRVEGLEWRSPCLIFIIERHGPTVLGSKRADLHLWELNMETKISVCTSNGYRQLRANAPRLDVDKIVASIIEIVRTGSRSDRNVISMEVGRLGLSPLDSYPIMGPRRPLRVVAVD